MYDRNIYRECLPMEASLTGSWLTSMHSTRMCKYPYTWHVHATTIFTEDRDVEPAQYPGLS